MKVSITIMIDHSANSQFFKITFKGFDMPHKYIQIYCKF